MSHLIRDLPIDHGKTRRVSTFVSPSGRAVRVETLSRGGDRLGSPFTLSAHDLPAFLAALSDAAAAIGVTVPASAAPQSDAEPVTVHLTRARAL
jgi:hypothetical protein